MKIFDDELLKTGLFVLIGFVVISLSILFLGQERTLFSDTYVLQTNFRQVQGLNAGSQVALAGLRIGSVSNISFSSEKQDLVVTMEIEKKFQNRVTEGTIASVKTMGALGDKYVYLTPGPRDGQSLKENSFVEADTSDDLFDAIAKKGNDLGVVLEVANELNVLLKNINLNGNSRNLVENLVSGAKEMKLLMSETREASKHLTSVMAKIDRGDGTLGALVNDPTLHNKLLGLTGESPRRQFLKPLIRESINFQDKASKQNK